MLNSTIILKVKQRLNKLASSDYDNIEDWQIIEAFNKGQVDWARRNLHGLNIVKEGDEQSTRRIDDLQPLLVTTGESLIPSLLLTRRAGFFEAPVPGDYMQWKRISAKASNECCSDPRPMVIYLAEVGNVDELLRDKNKQPSFDWAETFATMKGDKIQIYTNDEFDIVDAILIYYRQPIRIQMNGIVDPYTGLTSTTDVICEFKDDLVEVLIDESVKIIAGDIESMVQIQREGQSVENNN